MSASVETAKVSSEDVHDSPAAAEELPPARDEPREEQDESLMQREPDNRFDGHFALRCGVLGASMLCSDEHEWRQKKSWVEGHVGGQREGENGGDDGACCWSKSAPCPNEWDHRRRRT